ncbi:MAG: divergent polysaccharide deacetylase family protein [Gammaproteobacteria bacterium]|nr:divergent polysaccharide deacetylase family protein [Gammaproteobacteria bacterium]
MKPKAHGSNAFTGCWIALTSLCFILNLISIPNLARAEEFSGFEKPTFISIIIDDIGYGLRAGLRAVNLPGEISYSFLPHTPFVHRLATMAHSKGRDIILHVPMEPLEKHPLGPGGLTHDMDHQEFVDTLNAGLASVPYVNGVSNHMGSLLTRRPKLMRWFMQTLKKQDGLFFVDSRTTARSIALGSARTAGIPSMSRDIFLDHDPSPERIHQQLKRLFRVAKERGTALGVGHPYPETLEILERVLPTLEEQGIRIVKVSELMEIRKRPMSWRVSLFRSPIKRKKLAP